MYHMKYIKILIVRRKNNVKVLTNLIYFQKSNKIYNHIKKATLFIILNFLNSFTQ